MQSFEIPVAELALSADEVLTEMGYRDSMPDPTVVELTREIVGTVTERAIPACRFDLHAGALAPDRVTLDTGCTLLVGNTIGKLLQGASRFALFTATAGEAFQAYLEELKRKDDVLAVFIADTLGSLLVEKAGDRMMLRLRDAVAPEKRTNRFSPGYCGWHLSEQRLLFDAMGGAPCGIRLTESHLMLPVKSISGIVGIGPEVTENRYGCSYCELKTCYKKKIRTQP